MIEAPLAHPLTPRLAGGSRVYLTGEDHLRLTSFNSAAGVALAIEARYLDLDGRLIPSADRHVPNTNRTTASSIIGLGEGWLVDVVVRASAGTPRVGQCFVILELVRGLTGAVAPLAVLAQGYVTDTSRFGYPGSKVRASIDGPGVLRSITGTNPAAGAEISESVPANARWRPLSIDFVLVTDATVANREVVLRINDGATPVAEVNTGVSQTATQTRRYSFTRNVQRGTPTASTTITAPMPDVWLPENFILTTLTAGLVAGDDFGGPMLLVEEWIED